MERRFYILYTCMTFKTAYNLEKDIDNYLRAVWNFTYLEHGRNQVREKLLRQLPEQVQTELLRAKNEKEAKQVIATFLSHLPTSYQNTTPMIVLGVDKLLNSAKRGIIDILETVYQSPFPFKIIRVYLTTLSMQPYSYEEVWYMTYRNNTLEKHLDVTKHELNHFMFYYYFRDKLVKQGISNLRIEQLKEALAILTNPEGNDKPDIKELEHHIFTRKELPIEKIIENCIQKGW